MNIKNCFLNLCSFPHQVWYIFSSTWNFYEIINLISLKLCWKQLLQNGCLRFQLCHIFPNYFWFPFSLLSQWYFLLIMVGYFKERNFRGKKLRGFRVFCQKFIPTNYFKIVQSGKFIPRNGFTISILPKFTYFTEFYN